MRWQVSFGCLVLAGASTLATAAAGQPLARVGPDGEPLDEDGEVIFAPETAESVRPKGEDPPVSPIPEPAPKADPKPLRPRHRVEYDSLLGLRYNPLGAVERFNLFYRYRVNDLPGDLYRDADVGIGIVPWVSPAFVRIGPMLELKPLTILTLQAGYFFIGQFGSFGQLQGFDSATDEYDDDTLDERDAEGLARATTGHELQVNAQILLKAGSVVIRDTASLYLAQQRLPDGQRVFYDLSLDIMRSNGQPTISNDLDIVYLTDFSLIAGLRFNQTQHFYGARDFRPGESTENINGPTMRIGPLFAYRFEDVNPQFRTPTVLLLSNWWVRHRYRTGAAQSPAIPNLSLAFVFKGDVWNSDHGWGGTPVETPQQSASLPAVSGL